MDKGERIVLRISKEEKEELKKISKKLHRSMSDTIRFLIREFDAKKNK